MFLHEKQENLVTHQLYTEIYLDVIANKEQIPGRALGESHLECLFRKGSCFQFPLHLAEAQVPIRVC